MAPGSDVGKRFGPYELRSLLGKGGMGEVYEAYDTVKDRVVALKLLSDELAQDPEYQVRFRRESQAAARLAEPHIIPIHDWGVIDGRLFIDMRLVPGSDLRTILQTSGALSPHRAVSVIEQIAAALDAAHADGLVHRDVKPANILVTEAGFAYLADFGIAHTEGDSAITMVGVAIGSYTYMAPERFDIGPVTSRADIYSLACVLHECLTGASPFPAASMSVLIRSHLAEPPPRPSVQRPGVPAALDAVIARGMAKDPNDRFPTATELARAARAALPAAAGAPAAGSAPATGGFARLVVRPPDPSRTGELSAVAPESTGEVSLPVIRPSGPTEVSPTETQFTLPTQEIGVAPGTGPVPQVRPFPDAHLYEGAQLHPAVDPAARADMNDYASPAAPTLLGGLAAAASTGAGDESGAGMRGRGGSDAPYPPSETTRVYGAAESAPTARHPGAGDYRDEPDRGGYPADRETRVFGAGGFGTGPDDDRPDDRPSGGYPADQETRIYGAPVEPAPGYGSSPGYPQPAGYGAPPPPSYGEPAGYGTPDRPAGGGYGEEYAADQGGYPPGGYPPAGYQPDPYAPDPYAHDPYAPQGRRRSVVLPIVIGVLVVAVIAIGAVVGLQMFGSDDSESTTAQTTAAAPTSAAARTGGATGSARTSTTSARPTPIALPPGARPCGPPQTVAFANAAAGTQVTSCEFAEEVRKAYAAAAGGGRGSAPASVVAASPITGRTYTMSCSEQDRLVTCTGGDNAVVYVY
ncbi:serine/threonine-protein kinase [Nocardia cyriacigeorgica]|uniref:serine/threonine-protein kinase n=1 Tax=Nocardia cyriacigeorgica TaxID=135487 RepID=UPI001BB21835|nr:serine/threonine-protein kinase [Nocardia cyriacigeorgica]